MALVKYNNNSISAITSTGLATGDMVLIKSITASSDSTISFVDGSSDVDLDATYPIYLFQFINIHPSLDQRDFQFQVDTGTNTNYNQTITSTSFYAIHNEGDSTTGLGYNVNHDLAQGTGFQNLNANLGNGNDESLNGYLYLFNPSSTTFVKHFISLTTEYEYTDYTQQLYVAGYVNTTTALTRVQFKFNTGNIDAGKIKLYGLKDS